MNNLNQMQHENLNKFSFKTKPYKNSCDTTEPPFSPNLAKPFFHTNESPFNTDDQVTSHTRGVMSGYASLNLPLAYATKTNQNMSPSGSESTINLKSNEAINFDTNEIVPQVNMGHLNFEIENYSKKGYFIRGCFYKSFPNVLFWIKQKKKARSSWMKAYDASQKCFTTTRRPNHLRQHFRRQNPTWKLKCTIFLNGPLDGNVSFTILPCKQISFMFF